MALLTTPDARALPPPRGIVRAPRPDGLLVGRRLRPSAGLTPHIHHFWWIRWELRSPYDAEVLPHPAAQIIHVEEAGVGSANVVGLQTRRLVRTLVGTGQTFGITFRPTTFRALLRGSMATLTGRVVRLADVLGARANAWSSEVLAAATFDEKIAVAEAFLGPLLPPLPPDVVRLRDLVERVAHDRDVVRVGDLVRQSGLDARALQRAFRVYVGVGPKAVLGRYRLHDAAAQLASPEPPALADLAASLGYADQAHFGRDFKAAIGVTPLRFSIDFARGDEVRPEIEGLARVKRRLRSGRLTGPTGSEPGGVSAREAKTSRG